MNTPARWVNTEPDAGAPHALLERLAARVDPIVIDEIFIFPTRRIAIGESTVFVVAAREDDPERRRVITARYAVARSNKGVATVQEKIDEHGTAPAAAVARIIQGVLRRMGEEGEQAPRVERIEFELDRWWALVEELGGKRPAVAQEEGADGAVASADAAALAAAAGTPAAEPESADAAVAENGAEAEPEASLSGADADADVAPPDSADTPSVEGPIDGAEGSSYQ